MEKPYISKADIKEETVIKKEVRTDTVSADILPNTASNSNRLPKEEFKCEYTGNSRTICVPDISYYKVPQDLKFKDETRDAYIEEESEKEKSFITGHNDTDNSNIHTAISLQNTDTPEQKTDRTNTERKKKPPQSNRGRKYTTKFQCHNCGYKTYDKSNLTKHIQTHSKIKQFKCQFCEKPHGVKRELDAHIFKYHHEKAKELKENLISYKLYKCDHCEYQSFSATIVKNHITSRHPTTDIETLKCYNCDYETRIKKNLRVHIRKMHSNVQRKYHHCKFCDSKFLEKTSLACHILRKHKDKVDRTQVSSMLGCKILVCSTCSYECVNSNEMKHHMVNHGVPLDRPKYKCQKCDYATYSKSRLRKHGMIHDRVRPFVCFGCHKTFLRRDARDSHILVRHLEDDILIATVKSKSYKCQSCSYRTLALKELKRHMRVRHDVIEDKEN